MRQIYFLAIATILLIGCKQGRQEEAKPLIHFSPKIQLNKGELTISPGVHFANKTDRHQEVKVIVFTNSKNDDAYTFFGSFSNNYDRHSEGGMIGSITKPNSKDIKAIFLISVDGGTQTLHTEWHEVRIHQSNPSA